ncbi:uncharacterized protein LOC120351765 [Nilaparvata lugens]|uniref:uncharacterized protein LOC120351765 n=1 Tax=Nilaparvata lugens TaxID=108931 RepID=UPI00193E35E0|nr:uncharacterized protein LOC120351765 [Nilaparvata lugens]
MKELVKMSDVVATFMKHLNSTGLYSPQKPSYKGKLTYLVLIYVVFEVLYVMINSWKTWDFNSRVTALENLNLAIGIFNIATEHMHLHDRKYNQIQLMSSQLYLYDVREDVPNTMSIQSIFKEKEVFVESMEKDSIKLTNIIVTSLRWYFIGYLMSSLFGLVFYVISDDFNSLSLPIVFYNPFTPSPSISFMNFKQYVLILLFELWYTHLSFTLVITMGGFYFLSTDNVTREMKLFHMNLKELNLNFKSIEAADQKCDERNYEALKPICRRVFAHHQLIYKKVRMLNKGLDFIVMYYNPFICFQLCLAIFCIVKVDLIFKIKYGFAFFTVLLMSFIYCEKGQSLENEGEDLRDALYSCNWVGKPDWFCRSLMILMIQNNQIPKIETFGILTLNRKNLRGIMQAVYSYFNLLMRFSK